jgi:hypothetical protein
MNSKHLAAVMLIAVICGLLFGINKLKQQMQDADDAAAVAAMDLTSAVGQLAGANNLLNTARQKSAPHRKYLQMWTSELERTRSESQTKTEFGRMLKRFPQLVQFGTDIKLPVDNKDNAYVKQRVAGGVKLEGDLHRTLQLISSFERELPASRVASLEINKGQRANDVELDLIVDFPLIAAAPATPATPATPAAR